MNSCSLEEHYPSSESYLPPGCFGYPSPLMLADLEGPSPPPLDSTSDCPSVDSQETLSFYALSPLSSPVEGSTVPAMDNRTLQYSTVDEFYPLELPVPAHEIPGLDDTAGYSAMHGSVDMGPSSTQLYYGSSSTAPDYLLQSEYSTSHGPSMYRVPQPPGYGYTMCASGNVPTLPASDFGTPYMQEHYRHPARYAATPPVLSAADPIHTYYLAAPVPLSKSYVSLAPAHSARPILPRRQVTEAPTQPISGLRRYVTPQMPGSCMQRNASSIVSRAGDVRQATSHAPVLPGVPPPVVSMPVTNWSTAPSVYVPDPTADDFNDFIHFDQEDPAVPDASVSGASPYGPSPVGMPIGAYSMLAAQQTVDFADSELLRHKPEPDSTASELSDRESGSKPRSHSSSSQTTESEEGRYRTDPLYKQGPEPNGMYRCPFKDGYSHCGHKDTKLKCNYDKYIDSHLKPFRCKNNACVKQMFSSTACLLRHEREAHGLHGHGDRPHLCYYKGCERGQNGNGFPRRYNLFDHMKRVHGHRDDAVDVSGNPILGGETQKKIRGAKRKASSSPVPVALQQPAMQRQKGVALAHRGVGPAVFYHPGPRY